MGRKKIKITRIADDRNRSVTYLKRKAGLMKKAHELAILTGSEVAVIVFGQNGKLSEFCSSDMDRVLLRYTEHSGPVERRGPEHYDKDDDDGSDEGAGEDGEEDEDAGANNDAHGNQRSNANSGARTGEGAGRSQKRKAPGARKDTDGHSTSSASSSRRGSSPLTGPAPRITVDGSNAVDNVEAIDRDTLKAAIIQRTLSHRPTGAEAGPISPYNSAPVPRPAGVQHHHSFSTGDHILLQQQYNAAAMANFSPQRPNTAESKNGSGFANPAFGMSTRNMPGQFAFGPPALSHPSSMLGGMQPMPSQPGMPLRAHSAMGGAPDMGITYGDLARGGGGLNNGLPSIPQPQDALSRSAPFPPNDVGAAHLMPLAHPILRQHPQFESYQMQMRTQQQRNTSVPNIHTAPNSPGNLMNGQHGMQNSFLGTPQSALPASNVKRSASFGMATSGNGSGLLQTSFANHLAAPSPTAGFQSGSVTPDANANSPLPGQGMAAAQNYAVPSAQAGGATDTSHVDQPISNADFNELMGSILGDMTGTTEGDDSFATLTDSKEAGAPTGAAQPRPIPKSAIKDEQQTDDPMQSLDSEHSLSTLVNSDSFEGMLKGITGKGSGDFTTSHQDPGAQQQNAA